MNKNIFLLVFIILLSSCKKDDALWEVSNLNGNKISAFGHGGMGVEFKYPIDTYKSFEPVLRIGADGTEMDVQVTNDSVLVLYHHQKLEDGTSGHGVVSSKNWDDIKNCLHACPYSNSVNLIPASYLYDRVINKNDLTFTFDCKLYHEDLNELDHLNFLNRYANVLMKHISQYQIVSNSFIESSDTSFLRLLQNKNPALKLFYYTNSYKTGLDASKKINLYGITINHKLISSSEVTDAHNNNLRITLFDMQTENENLAAIQKNPDFMQSDKIIHLLKIFGEYKEQPLKKKFKW